MGGIAQKFVVTKPSVPIVWPIQEGTNLTQKEVTTLEEARFSFNHLFRNNTQSLFGFQSSSSNNFHVFVVSYHNLVKPSNASCWPTTHGGKKVKRPSMFKITQHMNNWEASRLYFQCYVFPVVDVPPPEYRRIYNILFNDNQYDVTMVISDVPPSSWLDP